MATDTQSTDVVPKELNPLTEQDYQALVAAERALNNATILTSHLSECGADCQQQRQLHEFLLNSILQAKARFFPGRP